MATTVTLKPNAIDISGSTSGTTTLQATAVAGTTTLTLPAATDTLVGKATTDTLTNKTLTGAVMNGTLGATTPSTVAATTISASSTATFAAGAVGTPSITTTGDTNTGIFFPAADTIAFSEGGAEAMRIDSDGDVGIGTSSPAFKLEVVGGTNNGIHIKDAASATVFGGLFTQASAFALVARSNHALTLGTNDTERMRIDSSGNVGIGTTSPSTYGQLAVYSSSSNVEIAAVTDGASYATVRVQNSSRRYSMQIRPDQSNAWVLRDENAGANRITVRDSDGVLFVPSVYATTNAAAANVYVGSDGSIVRSTSSLKYKKDVQDATHGLADVLKLRSVTYKGKSESNGDTVFGGFIAEEVDALGLTEFVQYADDESPDALAYGNMVALLTKAIQEQQALITALTARITALENK
jgi:hypothetical protein